MLSGNTAGKQRVTCQMLVSVDQARGYDTAGGVEDFGARMLGEQALARPDIDNDFAFDGNGVRGEHLTTWVHRDDVAAGDDQISHPATVRKSSGSGGLVDLAEERQ